MPSRDIKRAAKQKKRREAAEAKDIGIETREDTY